MQLEGRSAVVTGAGSGVGRASAKGAVHQLTRAVAVECAPDDIRVNAICPGAMPYDVYQERTERTIPVVVLSP